MKRLSYKIVSTTIFSTITVIFVIIVMLMLTSCEKSDDLIIRTEYDGTNITGTVSGIVPYSRYLIGFRVTNDNEPDVITTYCCKYNMNKTIISVPYTSLIHERGTYHINTSIQRYDSLNIVKEKLLGNEIIITY